MADTWTATKAQDDLAEIAFRLLAIQEQLEAIGKGLPVPANQDLMLEGYIAPALATEISGRIEWITEDPLRQVIDALQGATCLTAHDLERAFRKEHHRRRGY